MYWKYCSVSFVVLSWFKSSASGYNVAAVEILDLDIIPYEKIAQGDLTAIQALDKALHLKDIRKGIPGNLSGGTNPDYETSVGHGAIDIPSVIKAAVKAGIQHYYIEDESSRVLRQVPVTIAYLQGLRWWFYSDGFQTNRYKGN